jgi:hypothetical protein
MVGRSNMNLSPTQRVKTIIRAAVVAAAAALLGGCQPMSAEEVYPVGRDVSPQAARAILQDVAEVDVPFEDVVEGTGRVAQWGRRWTVRLVPTAGAETAMGPAEVQFLFPALTLDHLAGGAFESGWMPMELAFALAGMRVGGTRRVTLHAQEPPSGKRSNYARWTPHYSGSKDANYERDVRDMRTGLWVLQLAADRTVTVDATLLAVCRPHYTALSGKTLIDVYTTRTVIGHGCE